MPLLRYEEEEEKEVLNAMTPTKMYELQPYWK
jgi:hypothetical protein